MAEALGPASIHMYLNRQDLKRVHVKSQYKLEGQSKMHDLNKLQHFKDTPLRQTSLCSCGQL